MTRTLDAPEAHDPERQRSRFSAWWRRRSVGKQAAIIMATAVSFFVVIGVIGAAASAQQTGLTSETPLCARHPEACAVGYPEPVGDVVTSGYGGKPLSTKGWNNLTGELLATHNLPWCAANRKALKAFLRSEAANYPATPTDGVVSYMAQAGQLNHCGAQASPHASSPALQTTPTPPSGPVTPTPATAPGYNPTTGDEIPGECQSINGQWSCPPGIQADPSGELASHRPAPSSPLSAPSTPAPVPAPAPAPAPTTYAMPLPCNLVTASDVSGALGPNYGPAISAPGECTYPYRSGLASLDILVSQISGDLPPGTPVNGIGTTQSRPSHHLRPWALGPMGCRPPA
jgi:hypothetical protein